jgi:threonine/homoserine/homoserine lactone efflux protein
LSLLEWLTLAGVCLAGAASPGPSLAVVFGAGLAGGRSAGLAAAWSHAFGVALYATLTVLGISALIATQQWLYIIVQAAGAFYLLWLARGMWAHTVQTGDTTPAPERAVGNALRDGFAVAFLNPKLAVFMLALFSQFVRPDAGPLTSVQMIATAGLVDGCWYTVITLLFTQRGWIDRLRANATRLDRIFASLLTLLALSILLRLMLQLVPQL